MCGIAGFLGGRWQQGEAAMRSVLGAMGAAVAHRGPDSNGCWTDSAAAVGLAHRRLAVLDLSAAGAQPMRSAAGRYVIAFNGEIYNHSDLRGELARAFSAPCWRGHSDTETLLAGFEAWGVEATLRRALGMFAFALWDRRQRVLTLARDRLGEKPLYYGWQGSGSAASFLFGSELHALRAHPAFVPEVDRAALCQYLRHNHVPAPNSIYRGIRKLPPGCLAVVSLHAREPVLKRYWSALEAAHAGLADPFAGSPGQAVTALEVLLKDAVRRQSMADVPLGAFLSGGIDSSTVVALMQSQSARPVRTFTIGFAEKAFDEAVPARAVARHLGTDHTELVLTPEQVLEAVARMPAVYHEPFADASQLPTLLLAQLAREQVAVALSGDGGDELFGGYNRYALTRRFWPALQRVPRPLRELAAAGLRRVPVARWDALAAAGLWPGARWFAQLGHKLHKGARVLASRDGDALYLALLSHWSDPMRVVLGGVMEPAPVPLGTAPELHGLSDAQRMMTLDLLGYLPDDILTKLDRAAMSVSLETRVPLLDHRVVEFAQKLPLDLKLRRQDGGWQNKWVLREVLYRYLPRALVDRPKLGFGVPLAHWLRGPLRGWAEALLAPDRLAREGYFAPEPIRRVWAQHLTGAQDQQDRLWPVLMFGQWLEAGGATVRAGSD